MKKEMFQSRNYLLMSLYLRRHTKSREQNLIEKERVIHFYQSLPEMPDIKLFSNLSKAVQI